MSNFTDYQKHHIHEFVYKTTDIDNKIDESKTESTDTTYTMGFGNNINRNLIIHFAPYIQVENNKFSLIKSSSSSSEVSVLSQYQNKHIMLWFCKCGNLYE